MNLALLFDSSLLCACLQFILLQFDFVFLWLYEFAFQDTFYKQFLHSFDTELKQIQSPDVWRPSTRSLD